MFTKARIKLTSYYLAIIMAICLIFSYVIYHGFVTEFRRGLRIQDRIRGQIITQVPPDDIDPFGIVELPPSLNPGVEDQIFSQAQHRVVLDLVIINLSVLFISGVGGFFLAGKTLQPIEEVLNDHRRFTADASHELRTPLTAIKTEVEVALRDRELSLPEAKKLLKSNLEEVNKMQSLSNYLLDLNRYQNSQAKIELDRINFKKVVESSIEKLLPLAKKQNIGITARIADLSVRGNETALNQLVIILLDNAIKYSRKAGKINVTLTKRNQKAVLAVEDNGVGIKATEIPYIFNRFYRADSSRSKEQVNGYGLGLSIAKSIVELHNGTISVDSHFGQGSKFQVTLSMF
jgi:signal transduction histidine kinase